MPKSKVFIQLHLPNSVAELLGQSSHRGGCPLDPEFLTYSTNDRAGLRSHPLGSFSSIYGVAQVRVGAVERLSMLFHRKATTRPSNQW